MSKYSTFRYRSNKGRSGANVNDTMKQADPQNPSLLQESGTYLLYRPSYSDGHLVVMTPLNWQMADPGKPLLYQNLGIISYENRVIANMAVTGPQCGVSWISVIVNPAPYLIWYRKRTVISHWRRFSTGTKSFSLRITDLGFFCDQAAPKCY